MKRFLFVFSMLLLACSNTDETDPGTKIDSSAMNKAIPGMLPAYETPEEKKVGKADQYSDFRAAYPNVYGYTKAPSLSVVAAAQHDKAAGMFITWYNTFADVYASIIHATEDVVPVYLLVQSNSEAQSVKYWLNNNGVSTSHVSFVNMSFDSIWIRDFGPLSVITSSNKVGFIDNIYYSYRVYDDAVPTLLADEINVSVYRIPLTYEGGNFQTDGHGLCFMTTQTLSQNPYYSQLEVEKLLRDYLGCRKTVWVRPLEGEGTGHIDMFFKILNDKSVIVGQYDRSSDYDNAILLDDTAADLSETTNVNGELLDVTRIPMPTNADGVWRTYTNSLIVNKTVLIPVYDRDKSKEQAALAIYRQLLPGYDLIGIDSSDLITWSGAIHCIAMTFPSGDFSPIGGSASMTCTDVPPQGKCVGDTLTYCETGEVKTVNCADLGKKCGYSESAQSYTCLETQTSASSSSACGDLTYTGVCSENVLYWCENDKPYKSDCSRLNKTCRWDASNQFYNCL